MKTLLLLPLALCAAPALAMHAYSEESCVLKIPGNKITFERPDSITNYFQVFDEKQTFAGNGIYQNIGEDEPTSPQIVLVGGKNRRERKRRFSDGCFEGYKFQFQRRAKVASISDELAKQLGVRAGDTLSLQCRGEMIAPTGPRCDQ